MPKFSLGRCLRPQPAVSTLASNSGTPLPIHRLEQLSIGTMESFNSGCKTLYSWPVGERMCTHFWVEVKAKLAICTQSQKILDRTLVLVECFVFTGIWRLNHVSYQAPSAQQMDLISPGHVFTGKFTQQENSSNPSCYPHHVIYLASVCHMIALLIHLLFLWRYNRFVFATEVRRPDLMNEFSCKHIALAKWYRH